MNHATEKTGGFAIVGLGIKTTNEEGRAALDINTLWQHFFEQEIIDQIPGREGPDLYAVYWGYEGDHTKPYRVTLGCKTKAAAPNGLEKIDVAESIYTVVAAQGEQPAALIAAWDSIWKSDLKRSFKTDFELYTPRFFEPGLHEVLVYVGTN